MQVIQFQLKPSFKQVQAEDFQHTHVLQYSILCQTILLQTYDGHPP